MVIFDKKEVGNRIIYLQKILGLNSLHFANSIKADPSYFSKVRRGHRPISKTYIEAIEGKYRVSRPWLLFGVGSIFQNGQNLPYTVLEEAQEVIQEQEPAYVHPEKQQLKVLKMRLPLNKHGNLVPVTNDEGTAGTVIFTENEPEIILEYVDVPHIGWVEGVVEVVGESMHPTFKHGDRAAVRRLENPALLNWGEYYYVVDINWQGVIRRVLEGGGTEFLFLQADNPDQKTYPLIKRKWKEVGAIFKVLAAIVRY